MDILEAIRAGEAPREVRISAAKGLLPLEPSGMIEVLHRFSQDEDEEIRAASTASIAGIPDTILEAALFDEAWPPELLHFYAQNCEGRPGPLEAVILNPSSPDLALLELARQVPADLMELIVINQVRILREPGILAALLENPAINAHIRGRVNELKFDFFEKKEAPPPVADLTQELEVPDLPVEEIAVPVDSGPTDSEMDAEEGGPEKKETLFAKLTRLDITGKIRLAKMGSREERMQLVKSPNRLICTAAVRSPKITDSEVDSIAQLRNVHEDVLRYVATKREWTRRYSLVVNLVQNPRTPIAVSLGFVNRLTPLDLRVLSRNRDIPEVIRKTGKRKLAQKLSKG